MAKITLQDPMTGYSSVATFTANNDELEDHLNNKILYRDNPAGEINTMQNDLDMNSNRILNLPNATANGEPLTYGQWSAGATTTEFTGYLYETHVATASQDVFTLSNSYTVGLGSLRVFIDGVFQNPNNYSEDSSTQITFNTGLSAGEEVTFVITSFDSASSLDATTVTYTATATGAVQTNVQARLTANLVATTDFGAVGDGSVDDTAALQAALDAQVPVYLPPGKYRTTSELTYSDGSHLYGPVSFAGIRSQNGLVYDESRHAVIFYNGAGGSNSCVVRMSETAVGTQLSDITPQETHDLIDVRLQDIVIDANGTAEIGLYCYRLVGNRIGPVTVTGATEHGILIVGCFTNVFEMLQAHANEKNGITVGPDLYGWTAGEFAVNLCTFIMPAAKDNGTAETYNESSNEDEGHGFYLALNRGNVILSPSAENNDGAGMYIINNGSYFGGPNKIIGGYLEANQSDVVSDARGTTAYNLMIELYDETKCLEFDGTYFSGSGDILIDRVGTVMINRDEWPTFRNCQSTSQVDINSDISTFHIDKFVPYPSFSGERPDVKEVSFTTTGAAIHVAATNPVYTQIELTSTSATSTGALTLEDGKDGDRIHIFMVADAGTAGVITHNGTNINLGNASTITFDDVGDNADMEFRNGAWYFMGGTATVA